MTDRPPPPKRIDWIDAGRAPQCRPDPRYPHGIDLQPLGAHTGIMCKVDLPYPAKRCGYYVIECPTCDAVAIATTAGRPDDPRSIAIPCRLGT